MLKKFIVIILFLFEKNYHVDLKMYYFPKKINTINTKI